VGIVIRQSSYSVALTVVGILIGYINVLYFFPAYFSTTEIGITRVIQDFAMLLVPLAQLGTGQAIVRFFPGFQKDPRKKDHFLTLMLFLGTVGFIAFFILFYFLERPISGLFISRAPDVNTYLHLVIILVFILVITNILTDFIRSILQIIIPVAAKEVLLRLFTTACIALFAVGIVSFDLFLACIVGAYMLNMLILAFYLVTKGKFKLRIGFLRVFSGGDLGQILNYGFFALLGTGGALIIAKVDSVMVTSMLGADFNGIYTTVFFIAVLIEIPRRIVTQISSPLIARSWENNRQDEIQSIYKKSSLNMMIVGGLLFIGIWANIDNLFLLIPNNEVFVVGKWVVIILGASKLIDMTAGLNGEIIVLSRYYKMNILFTASLAVITVTANYVFIPIYGITGAALGTGLSILLFNMTKYIFLLRVLRFQPLSIGNLKVLLIGSTVFLVAVVTPRITYPILDIIIRSVLMTALYGGLLVFTNTSDEVSDIFKKIRRKLLP